MTAMWTSHVTNTKYRLCSTQHFTDISFKCSCRNMLLHDRHINTLTPHRLRGVNLPVQHHQPVFDQDHYVVAISTKATTVRHIWPIYRFKLWVCLLLTAVPGYSRQRCNDRHYCLLLLLLLSSLFLLSSPSFNTTRATAMVNCRKQY